MIARSLPTLAIALWVGGGVARAGLQVPPIPNLPAVPSAPSLWFDGSRPGEVAALLERVTHPRTRHHFEALVSYVDGEVDGLAGADDETRAKVALAAALLSALGEVPPPGSGYASYRDVAVLALQGIGTRQAIDDVVEVFWRPRDAIDLVADTSLLSSMAQAYDLLRGSGLPHDDDAALRALLGRWANALRDDWNLRGGLGVAARRDTWGIKAGASLLTVALALPDHADAESWRAAAMTYLQGSLDVVAGATGWYTEGARTLGHALATLVPCAWHVRHTTGIDWFPALRPLVTAAFALRQPDGRAPPLEDGLGVTFPWDVLAPAYPDLTAAMLWAWEHSPRDAGPFEEHQLHDVTRFILVDLETVAAPPGAPQSRFVADPANVATLRSSWHADALVTTFITARDHATSEALTARHHTRSPLELVVHGAGRLVMPTASGGPRLAASGSRVDYLAPYARNLPLIDDAAPFVRPGDDVRFGDRLDSRDEGARRNRYLDLASTALVDVYEMDAVVETRVTRLVAMVDEAYVVVMDQQLLDEAHAVDLMWRGRGTRSARPSDPSVQRFSWAGPGDAGPRMDLDVVATSSLGSQAHNSLYADAWDVEEPIDAVRVGTTATTTAFISVIQVGDAAARAVDPIGDTTVAAATVTSGAVVDTLLHNLGDANVSAGAITTDARAAFVRMSDGALGPVGAVRVRSLTLASGASLGTTAEATLVLTPSADGLVIEVSPDRPGPFDLTLEGWPALDPDDVYEARLEGAALTVTRGEGAVTVRGVRGGTLVIAPAPCRVGSGGDGDGDRVCGSADVCPTIADDQTDTDGDGVGDACECLDAQARCDDASSCTGDGCDPKTGACTWTNVDGVACTDADACTGDDRCAAGVCVGAPIICDDRDPCTSDACVQGACVHTLMVGAGCDDGDPCTARDSCGQSGRCAGQTFTCEDGNPCTQEACDPSRGCVVTSVDVGARCDDGSICTSDDRCASDGACRGTVALACDDGDPCTADRCDPLTGCEAFAAEDGLGCHDGDRCTTDDRCVQGGCVGSPMACDDGNTCTTDRCDPVLGCVREPQADGTGCDDGNACTSGDACQAGGCVGLGVDCDDGDPCTIDGCEDALGCVHTSAADGLGCDDGDPCTDGDVCVEGACAGKAAVCDDLDPCTRDRCATGSGCVSEAMDEGSECGPARVCFDGACIDATIVDEGPEPVEVVEEIVVEPVEPVEPVEVVGPGDVIEDAGVIVPAEVIEDAEVAIGDASVSEDAAPGHDVGPKPPSEGTDGAEVDDAEVVPELEVDAAYHEDRDTPERPLGDEGCRSGLGSGWLTWLCLGAWGAWWRARHATGTRSTAAVPPHTDRLVALQHRARPVALVHRRADRRLRRGQSRPIGDL